MARATKEGRAYRGMTAEERDADRRRRLIDSGIEVFGTTGFAASTIEGLCAHAGVTARNFYDHFASREELLAAVYDAVIAEHVERTVSALEGGPEDLEGSVRAGLQAAVDAWIDDERRFRIAEIEVVGVSERLEQRRFEVFDAYAHVIADNARALMSRGAIPERDPSLTAIALLGATNQLLLDWLRRSERPPIGPVVDELVRLYVCGLSDA